MTQTQHTPGPWRFQPHGPNGHFYGNILGSYGVGDFGIEEVRTITCQTRFGALDEIEANARLIATAPELLECARLGWLMCNAMILAAEQSGKPLPSNHYAVRDLPKFEAAIASATGAK
jgi:hypothetical protein